jgi:hypothetical protein
MSYLTTPGTLFAKRIGTTSISIVSAEKHQLVTLVKNTSGTIVVSTSGQATVGSASGISLQSGQPLYLYMEPGTQIYAIGSDEDEAVGIYIQQVPVPYLISLIEKIANVKPKASPRAPAQPYPGTAEFKSWVRSKGKKA